MQINKTYLIVGGLMAALAGATAYLVLKAPATPGSSSSGPAEGLAKPRALAIDKKGNVVIVDSKNNRIVIQKKDGSLVRRFSKLGTAKGELREPCGVAVSSKGDIYVADTFHTLDPNGGLPWGRIQKFEDDGDFDAVLPKPEEGSTDFFGPRAVAVDPSDRVWVSDTGNHRLLVYGADGKFLKSLGQKGKGELEFQEPFGLAFDPQGNAYVADRLNTRIEVISKDFAFVRSIKVDGWEAAQINQEPYVAVDAAKGKLYVSDPTKNKVLVYGLDGKKQPALTQGMEGPAAVPFNLPTGLAVSEGVLYVSNGGDGRILTVKP
jgi:DNA-binding beta-propeller fold protein YncE